jgi:hypothetical protein
MENQMDVKILEKIQKLLALAADNPDGHESKLAAERAADLMAKYDVGIEDIDSHTGKMKQGAVVQETVDVIANFHQIWESSLGNLLCDCFDCKRFIQTVDSKVISRSFLGAKSDVKLAVWFYKYLRLRIAKEAEKKYKTQRDQKSFGIGAVQGLAPRLTEMYKRKVDATPVDSRALVLTKQLAVQERYDEIAKTFTRKNRTYSANNITGAYHHGVEAGKTMSINQQIGG